MSKVFGVVRAIFDEPVVVEVEKISNNNNNNNIIIIINNNFF